VLCLNDTSLYIYIYLIATFNQMTNFHPNDILFNILQSVITVQLPRSVSWLTLTKQCQANCQSGSRTDRFQLLYASPKLNLTKQSKAKQNKIKQNSTQLIQYISTEPLLSWQHQYTWSGLQEVPKCDMCHSHVGCLIRESAEHISVQWCWQMTLESPCQPPIPNCLPWYWS
jgi:hypothetical protein